MAMVLPVMFLVFLGIFWAGRIYNIYATVNQAAREGARVAAQATCMTCGTGNVPGDDTAVFDAVKAVMLADHLDLTKIPTPGFATPTGCGGRAACTQPGNVWVCRNVLLTPTGTPQECGVLVEFSYPLDLPQISKMSAFGNPNIAGHAQMRAEQ
jgi:hypothetical protein